MRSRVGAIAVLLVLASLAPVAAHADSRQGAEAAPGDLTRGVGLDVVVSGMSLAVDMAAPPGDSRLFVAEKTGRIRIIENGRALPTPFLDLTGPVQSSANEQGLLGLAFPDDYASTGRFYVHYTSDAGNGDTAVAAYTVSDDPNRADADSAELLLTLNQPYSNHNGGSIQVGPDGYLYVGLGDGGGGGDPGENGQNKGTLLGTILRLDPATGAAAAGNPFVGKAGADEIWAWGLRNPWRFSFDAATGDLYIGDVGQGSREEIDVAPAGVGGLNFGWDALEGTTCYEGPCDAPGLTAPVHEYGHGPGPICGSSGGSVTGGYVYRGNELPWLRGHYFYADWCLGKLASFRLVDGVARQHIDWSSRLNVPAAIASFGVDGFGELYFLAQGSIYRFVSERNPECDFDGDGAAEATIGVPGERLSGNSAAGRVVVIEGNPDGPVVPSSSRALRRGDALPGEPHTDDRLGEAIACGDFNGDGYSDIVMGAPGAASVLVMYGSAAGLSSSESWSQQSLGVGGDRAADQFGSAIAAGDINRDGFDDVVVGAPGDDESGLKGSGSFTVIFGSRTGLTQAGAELIHGSVDRIIGTARRAARLGAAVEVSDVDGDGFADVVAGAPGARIAGETGAGYVMVVFGQGGGTLGRRDSRIHRAQPGIAGSPRQGDAFGSAIAGGTLDNNGFDDLVIGLERRRGAGMVHVIYGSADGPSRRDLVMRQGKGGVPGMAEAGDRFGAALDTGDADGDGFDEVAIGVPGESYAGLEGAGVVVVVSGGPSGLDRDTARVWAQGRPAIIGEPLAGGAFGHAVRFARMRGVPRSDLLVGAPGGGGSVAYLRGTPSGVSPRGDQRWTQETPGMVGSTQPADRFGGAL